MTKTLDEKMSEMIQSDGGLFSLGGYVGWSPGDPDGATLDGNFTHDELKWIADYMEKHNGQ